MARDKNGEIFAEEGWWGFGGPGLFATGSSGEGGSADGGAEQAGGGSASGGSEGEGGTDSGTEAQAQAQAQEQQEGGEAQSQEVQKPEWLAEKHWSKDLITEDGRIDALQLAERLEKSRQHAERQLGLRADDLKAELKKEMQQEIPEGVPATPDQYEAKVPEYLRKEQPDLELNQDDPFLQFFKNKAHQFNLPQSAFNEVIGEYVEMRMREIPDYDTEMENLGEHGPERAQRIANWAKGALSKERYEQLASMVVTADAVEFFEEIMELAGHPTLQIDDETGLQSHESYTREELQSMMQDERYWKNGGDPAYVRKIRAAFARLGRTG